VTTPAAPTFTPTAEQVEALRLFATGESLVIEAGAGTGKTSTLKLLAESTERRVQYVAFNKALVTDAKAKMPPHVRCNTAHSLAFGAVGKVYAARMNASRRMRSNEVARILRIDPMWVNVGGTERKHLGQGRLAGVVLSALAQFCRTADATPGTEHFPYIQGIDMPAPDGKRTYTNNREVARTLLPALKRAWADVQQVTGALNFTHDYYLKIWQLNDPHIASPVILFDEAQDANPVIAAIIAAQTHAQLVYVGDSNQSIMTFTGAVNALAEVEVTHRSYLTQSFRFGPAIAEKANTILGWLESPMMLRGLETLASSVGPVPEPDAILTRTNASAVAEVLRCQKAGVPVHLVGGSKEVVEFAEAAGELQQGCRTEHRDLWIFESWSQVLAYVDSDEQGSDLRLLVKLVEEFTVEVILTALRDMVPESQAKVVVSTAHRSKGREWATVRIGNDFPEVDEEGGGVSPEELRLLYVAVTRAKERVDVSACPALTEPAPEPTVPDEPAATAAPTFTCHGPGCFRSYALTARSGLADEQFCSGLCRAKASRGVCV
jgi:hypothetical protein